MAKKTRRNPKVGDAGEVDLAEIERLLAFMAKHGLEEFEYARGGVHVRLKKPSAAPVAVYGAPAPAEHHPAPVHVSGASDSAGAHHAPGPAAAADVHVVKSPIVGTFYSAPGPNADPFVTLGAKVDQGQVLCIIEAMKLMNEIEADVAGEIAQIFAENGEPVEYGEPLFGIRQTGKK
jgi:acetyl-CoA carboxylase biotin carboxyl carrier protein